MAVVKSKSIAVGTGVGVTIALVVLTLIFALSFTGKDPAGTSILDPTFAAQEIGEAAH